MAQVLVSKWFERKFTDEVISVWRKSEEDPGSFREQLGINICQLDDESERKGRQLGLLVFCGLCKDPELESTLQIKEEKARCHPLGRLLESVNIPRWRCLFWIELGEGKHNDWEGPHPWLMLESALVALPLASQWCMGKKSMTDTRGLTSRAKRQWIFVIYCWLFKVEISTTSQSPKMLLFKKEYIQALESPVPNAHVCRLLSFSPNFQLLLPSGYIFMLKEITSQWWLSFIKALLCTRRYLTLQQTCVLSVLWLSLRK